MESKSGTKPGIYLLDVPGLDRSVINRALADLKGIKIIRLSRKNVDGSFTYWDTIGKIIEASTTYRTTELFLAPGDIGIEIFGDSLNNDPSNTRVHTLSLPGTVHATTGSDVHSFSVLTGASGDYMDVKIHVYARYEVGKISAKIGSVTTIGGAHFQVAKYDGESFKGSELKVVITKTDPANQYRYRIIPKPDMPDGTNSHEKESNLAFNSFDQYFPASKTSEAKFESAYISKFPISEWEAIAIRRQVSLDGFVAHLPTHPTNNP